MPSKRHDPISRCRICGQPQGDQPIWYVDLDLYEHEECRDWNKTSFPFDGQLHSAKEVAVLVRAAFDVVVALGVELKTSRDQWPAEALQKLARIRERQHAVRVALTTLAEFKDWFR